MSNFVGGVGNPEPRLMIVGEAPGKHEEEQGLPFVGPSGLILGKVCEGIGHPNWRTECYITNIVKQKLIDNDWDKMEESGVFFQKEIEFLLEEIRVMNPNMLLVLGANAYDALKLPGKLDDYRGSILQAYGRKVIATYHPARFLYSRDGAGGFSWKPFEKAVFQADIQRAFTESEFREPNLPKRNLYVCENSNQFIQFLNRNEGRMQKCARDIESINFIPFCESFAFNKNEAVSVPLFDGPLGKSRSPNDKSRLWLLINKIDQDKRIKFIGQNFKYDEPKRRKLGLWIHSLYSDTMLKGHVVCPEFPKNLAFQTSIYTREPFYKHEYEAFKHGKSDIQKFMLYNAKDSAVTFEVDEVLEADLIELGMLEFYYEFVMQLHYLYMDMEETGMAINSEFRNELIAEWAKKQAKLEIELFHITGMHLNTSSPKQVQLALYEKLKLPWRKGTGEDVLVALLGNHAKKPEQKRAIELILLDRKVKRLLSTTLASPTDYDGRMRSSIFIAATETRRTSDMLLGVPIRPFNMGIGFKTLSKHGEAGVIRKMFVPDKGYVFINFDQSQAEARVCSLLADDEETLKNFDTIDIHALTASWAFGGDENKWSKARLGYECPERFIGKAQDLNSKILTPTGWKRMGDIQIGDKICNGYGTISQITGVFPQGIKDIYEVEFTDGAKTKCCAEHLWIYKTQWDKHRKLDFKINELKNINKFTNNKGNPTKFIPIADPIYFESLEILPLDPYVLGLLIGDGYFEQYSVGFSNHSNDSFLLDELKVRLEKYEIVHCGINDYRINGFSNLLGHFNFRNLKSINKYIPSNYLFSDRCSRLELLRGLMDTDGSIQENGSGIEYSTSSEQLALDVQFLVRSLGGLATITSRMPKFIYKEEHKIGNKSFRVFVSIQINPFKLPRKANRFKYDRKDYNRGFKNVKLVGKEECQCISVDSKDHLYVTDDFILTHNTLRHAGHLDMQKHTAMITINTDAQKFGIDVEVSEWKAGKLLEVFHKYTPKIRSVFHIGIQEALLRDSFFLTGTSPALNKNWFPKRQFYGDWDRDMWKEAYSFIPQQTVTDKTKLILLELKKNAPYMRQVGESHDAGLLLCPIPKIDEAVQTIKYYGEQPISFEKCSLPRRDLVIPIDIEIGESNYKDLRKYKISKELKSENVVVKTEIDARLVYQQTRR